MHDIRVLDECCDFKRFSPRKRAMHRSNVPLSPISGVWPAMLTNVDVIKSVNGSENGMDAVAKLPRPPLSALMIPMDTEMEE